MHQNYLKGLLKHSSLGPVPEPSVSYSVVWGKAHKCAFLIGSQVILGTEPRITALLTTCFQNWYYILQVIRKGT
jgi:hypothetical protein